jgi:acetyl esterase/lipase
VERHGDGDDVAVLLHGGFWKAEYDRTLMDALAEDLAARGWTAWNVEFRRLGNGGGVPETLDDVAVAIDLLEPRGRVVAIGHSAGGHLAAWAATRENPRVPVTAVVSQAGVLDLAQARELNLSNGVVNRFLKGAPTQLASPIERLPLTAPALVTHGGRDDTVPASMSEQFAAASGADLVVLPEEDHYGHLDPGNPLWKAVIEWL